MSTTATGKAAKRVPRLLNKRVLVVGGTSGIGFAVTTAAVELGASVIVSSSSKAKIDSTINDILEQAFRPLGSQASLTGCPCDLSNLDALEDNLRSLFDFATESKTCKLDHIVYTAGNKAGSVQLRDVDAQTITEHGILRFYAPILIGKLASSYMASNYESSITFTSGVNNVKPVNGRVLMAGWGAGVEGVTRGLAVDLKPIRVNCVCPGPTRTPLFGAFPPALLEPLIEKYRNAALVNAIGTSEDVAEAYIYCMKDRCVDGAVLHTSGGLLLA